MEFKVGQLVRYKPDFLKLDMYGAGSIGRVVAVDRDYYGAKQAFKVYGAQRGQAIGPWSANGIGPTKDGIRDRVKVRWIGDAKSGYEMMNKIWHDGKDLEIMEG